MKSVVRTSLVFNAAGYFLAYVPYAALTRALSDGVLTGAPVNGVALLPMSAIASLVTAAAYVIGFGLWRSAGTRRVGPLTLPVPSAFTAISGLCASLTIASTTLAYTFEGTSVLMMVLLMRGGVLALAPLVDLISGRKIKLASSIALGLSAGAVALAFRSGAHTLTVPAMVDLAVYLFSYFVRLRTMSARAKTTDRETTLRYFVEEQLVATPALVLILIVFAAAGHSGIRAGFVPGAFWPWALLIGVLSQGTGIFGALVLLGAEENSYCVPINRASSILAGVVASAGLWLLFGFAAVPKRELAAAVLLLSAIAVLAVPKGLLTFARNAQPAPARK